MNAEVTIRYRVWTRNGNSVVKEKTFKTEAAMVRWAEKNERDNPNWDGIEAYAYGR